RNGEGVPARYPGHEVGIGCRPQTRDEHLECLAGMAGWSVSPNSLNEMLFACPRVPRFHQSPEKLLQPLTRHRLALPGHRAEHFQRILHVSSVVNPDLWHNGVSLAWEFL